MAIEIRENEPLSKHSTFRIGGWARYFVVVKNVEELKEAIEFAKEKNLPYFVFGGGSNILFRDENFNGLIIKMGPPPSPLLIKEREKGRLIISAQAGTLLSQLINFVTENNLTGLEWGIGIPGTVGGCVVGNCGAFGQSISDCVKKVKTLEREYTKEECIFEYRDSRFKPRFNLDRTKVKPLSEVILEVELELKQDDKEKIKEIIKNNLLARKNKIPNQPSIGCIFKNLKNQKLNLKSVSVGALIEQCGLKGQRIGDAQISELHANFIVNLGKAKANDILELIKLCKEKVREKFSIDLEEEIVVI